MPPIITVLTCTAQEDPMFMDMANSIARAKGQLKIEWVVVDAMLWNEEYPRRAILSSIVADRFPLVHAPPKPSRWHGPHKDPTLGDKELPDINGARNTGLIHARGQALYLLDDCSVLSPAALGNAWAHCRLGRAVTHWYQKAPKGTPWRPMGGEPGPCEPTAFRGSAVAYPISWLEAVNGWDEDYGGERSGNDIEVAIRAYRAGMPCWADFHHGVHEFPHELLFDKSAFWTDSNDSKVSHLMASDRIMPIGNGTLDVQAERAKLHGGG